MAIFEVIKYEGPNDILCWKFTGEDFNTMSQLIVHESQEAILFKDGMALDLFGPGKHTLHTSNIPIINKIINLPFGGESPFHCEVYFINKVHSMDIRWGTKTPMPIKDPVYDIILPIGANGQFAVQVEDSRKFLTTMVGTIAYFDQNTLIEYFRGILMTQIKDYLAKQLVLNKITFLEIHSYLKNISDGIANSLSEKFSYYGIKLINFNVNSIMVPEDDPSYVRLRNTLDKKAEYKILGTNYQQSRTFDVLQSAAENEGSNQVMGAGIGLGLGVNMGSIFGNAMSDAIGNTDNIQMTPASGVSSVGMIKCNTCGEMLASNAKFCGSCGNPVLDDSIIKCPNCNAITAKGKFCSECGSALINSCRNCGAQLAANASFCSECGTKR